MAEVGGPWSRFRCGWECGQRTSIRSLLAGKRYPARLPEPSPVFLRELTQVQSTKFDHNYLRGWPGDRYGGPARKPVWSLHKTMEFVAPSIGGWLIKAAAIAAI